MAANKLSPWRTAAAVLGMAALCLGPATYAWAAACPAWTTPAYCAGTIEDVYATASACTGAAATVNATITAALGNLAAAVAAEDCVIIRDSWTYTTQVTVANFAPSGGYNGTL